MKIKGLIILVIIISLLIPCFTGCQSSSSLELGKAAPGFKLKDLDGQTVSLGSLEGRYVIINYWSTSCTPCVNEMPHLQEFYDEMDKDKIALLLINGGESEDAVKRFCNDNNYTMPVLLDSKLSFAEIYKIRYFPTTFFIDPEGVFRLSVVGAFKDKQALERKLSEIRQ
jgi:peroxiredoxin